MRNKKKRSYRMLPLQIAYLIVFLLSYLLFGLLLTLSGYLFHYDPSAGTVGAILLYLLAVATASTMINSIVSGRYLEPALLGTLICFLLTFLLSLAGGGRFQPGMTLLKLFCSFFVTLLSFIFVGRRVRIKRAKTRARRRSA